MVISMDRWRGKVAVVSGTSSGLGAAIADLLVENGLQVVGIARRIDLVEKRAESLTEKPGKLIPYQADFSQESEIIKAFEWIESNLGPVSILINNAGTSRDGNLIDGKLENWKLVFDLNVLGLSIATREAIKSMRKHKINGHIIHINSYAGHCVPNVPNFNVYPASKHAVTALTETLRQELIRIKSNIKITSLSPGLAASELTTERKDLSPEGKALLSQLPCMKATDVADAVIYILSTPPSVQVHELILKPVGEPY